jgi:hypothetical protein
MFPRTHRVPGAVQLLLAQQGWFGPPQLPQLPLAHIPWLPQFICAAMHFCATQQPPLPQELAPQQAIPSPPQPTHAPPVHNIPCPQLAPSSTQTLLAQQLGIEQVLPWQQGWFCPPQPAQVPFWVHRSPPEHCAPTAMQALRVLSQQPVPHIWLGQQGCPGMPHAAHTPIAQVVFIPVQVPMAQQGWPAPPHATQTLLAQVFP